MEEAELLKRIRELEEAILTIKNELEPKGQQNKFLSKFHKLGKFVISYWVLISFLIAIGTAVYVKFAFNIDFFENYRNVSTTKKLSDFYRTLGDRMMARIELKAAEEAYKAALKIDPNNMAACNGLVKAQVFQPLPNEKYVPGEVIDTKLAYLSELFPGDYIVDFLKGVRYWHQGDTEKATLFLKKSIEKNPQFAGAYLQLGYIAQNRFDIEESIKYLSKALEIDPNNAQANNNLGFIYIITSNFEQAIKHLSKSDAISPSLLTAINLGDAYRFLGNYDTALRIHRFAIENTNEQNIEGDRYISGEWTYNLMPVDKQDKETIKRYVKAYTTKDKKSIAHFALSLDHALVNNFDAASTELDNALKFDPSRRYRVFFANKMFFLKQNLKISNQVKLWLEQHEKKL